MVSLMQVQRMGRTGRKRHGRIVVLVTEGKEAQVYNRSMYQRNTILKTIMSGALAGGITASLVQAHALKWKDPLNISF